MKVRASESRNVVFGSDDEKAGDSSGIVIPTARPPARLMRDHYSYRITLVETASFNKSWKQISYQDHPIFHVSLGGDVLVRRTTFYTTHNQLNEAVFALIPLKLWSPALTIFFL